MGTSSSVIRAKPRIQKVLIKICFSLLIGLKRLLKFKYFFHFKLWVHLCLFPLCPHLKATDFYCNECNCTEAKLMTNKLKISVECPTVQHIKMSQFVKQMVWLGGGGGGKKQLSSISLKSWNASSCF